MGARTSEYTLEEAKRHMGKRFLVVKPFGHYPEGTVFEAIRAEPFRDGYALAMEVVYCGIADVPSTPQLSLAEVRKHLTEY